MVGIRKGFGSGLDLGKILEGFPIEGIWKDLGVRLSKGFGGNLKVFWVSGRFWKDFGRIWGFGSGLGRIWDFGLGLGRILEGFWILEGVWKDLAGFQRGFRTTSELKEVEGFYVGRILKGFWMMVFGRILKGIWQCVGRTSDSGWIWEGSKIWKDFEISKEDFGRSLK